MDNKGVKLWMEMVTIPTYSIGKRNKNPMFLENRVYQGSSGVVYPHAVVEKIHDEKEDRTYIGLFLENDYIKMMVLPELGGRIQMAFDKIKNRHFVYYNQVIKPALVGLTGPWISGGIEFNWPQHHRPSTFDPVDYAIEENADGSKTIWVNEIEKMFHTKGMAGFTLYPDKAYIEISAKLLNRSELPQTFLWWANPAVKVNDYYQSVFPPDVNAVFDHGKRDVSSFPIATGTYYKVDYAPGTDISMYKNIPVPTSYMAINSDYDFVGGYEHDTMAGMLHVANHHVSPGKKQWTWGNGDFGIAWDRNLTDQDGPYIELMTGMFTDNQPDFTWLMPNEEKSFKQYFLPYRELGMIQNASKDILLAIQPVVEGMELKIQVTSVQKSLGIEVYQNGEEIFKEEATVSVEQVYLKIIKTALSQGIKGILIIIKNAAGRELLRFDPETGRENKLPESAKPALSPQEINSIEELFLTGQHLEQYRHATFSPVPYYQEALRREPSDIRTNNAMGLWYLRRGQFGLSEGFFRTAINTSVKRNPNPYDSEPYYNLGLCLKFLGREKEAYDAFYKSSWGKAWKDTAYFSIGRIDICNENYTLALEHLERAIENNGANSKAYVLLATVMRRLSLSDQANNICKLARQKDKFNLGIVYEQMCSSKDAEDSAGYNYFKQELFDLSRGDIHNIIEYAIDYFWAGLYTDAIQLLSLFIQPGSSGPMSCYFIGYFFHKKGEDATALEWFRKASEESPYLCFPNRLEEILVLEAAIKINTEDALAPYYLGNLYYDKRQYDMAIENWELSLARNGEFATVYRNLGIAYFNKRSNSQMALKYFETALNLDPADDRICMELHQLYKRLNWDNAFRLRFLQANMTSVMERDDLYLEMVTLLNIMGNHEEALNMLLSRKFHPWEGGEGKVSNQYVMGKLELAKIAIIENNFQQAITLLKEAQQYPHSLGEGKLFGTRENDIFYWLACAYAATGDKDAAEGNFSLATLGTSEPSAAMFYNDQQPDKIFYQGLAWNQLGKADQAKEIFNGLISYGKEHYDDAVKIDYFAVSLPDMLIFEDDLTRRNQIHCRFISGLGHLGSGNTQLAIKTFEEVLSQDAAHSGAITHLKLALNQSRQILNTRITQ
ncbi:DUF5107 domain-containing protein [Sphingobacterium sp. SRCM116780]|uniref:DUF5107 domain-containing protein n=1 Tax=Sphingobacterium sp. SRCM116780 TaxID=2907623 RepID=UPI001F18CD4B|nr:DUF5107 domain-containing protein [Sphingobacterium sp. SRCM116780]UIR57528.1 DUF5107 domain-containing protein [Sphingobacterium sp. SRCM116780]